MKTQSTGPDLAISDQYPPPLSHAVTGHVHRTPTQEIPHVGRISRVMGRWLAPWLLAGRAAVEISNGTREEVQESHRTKAANGPRLVVWDDRALGAALRYGSRGLGWGYIAGWWDSDDPVGLVATLASRIEPVRKRIDALFDRLAPLLDLFGYLNKPGPAEDRKAIRAHYDLPEIIFRAMLDETLTYSCAVFDPLELDLVAAQREKFDRLLDPLDLNHRKHLLEIGTGWGSLAIYAARTRDCKVTTTTVSVAQELAAREEVDKQGLSEQVEVLGSDWRDLDGRFDALVSVEMIEAVDWRNHKAFFTKCRGLLHDEGRMTMQAIVIDEAAEARARHRPDFIRAQVFPNSCIPSLSRLLHLAGKAGLQAMQITDIGHHYVETLKRWRSNLDEASNTLIASGIDFSLVRMFQFYLAYCQAAFELRHISDVQIVFVPKPLTARR